MHAHLGGVPHAHVAVCAGRKDALPLRIELQHFDVCTPPAQLSEHTAAPEAGPLLDVMSCLGQAWRLPDSRPVAAADPGKKR